MQTKLRTPKPRTPQNETTPQSTIWGSFFYPIASDLSEKGLASVDALLQALPPLLAGRA